MLPLWSAAVPSHLCRSFIVFILQKSLACVPPQKVRLSEYDEGIQLVPINGILETAIFDLGQFPNRCRASEPWTV